jgi:hypothetical protein
MPDARPKHFHYPQTFLNEDAAFHGAAHSLYGADHNAR